MVFFIKSCIWLFGSHYIADYPLQGDWLSSTKGTNFYSLLSHGVIYATAICMCFEYIGVFDVWKFPILVLSHMIIDYVKANAKDKIKKETTYMYIDQALHHAINFGLMLI